MKQHALLLSTEMVLATLAGLKSCTRRTPNCTNSLINGKRLSGKAWKALNLDFTKYNVCEADGGTWFEIWSNGLQGYVDVQPVYKEGDGLWFRENLICKGETVIYEAGEEIWYDKPIDFHYREPGYTGRIPGIHMPRSACRLFATCRGAVCEHLHDITEEQAIREGVERCGTHGYRNYLSDQPMLCKVRARESFISLWQSINGPDSWQLNPPVYAISFKLAPEL